MQISETSYHTQSKSQATAEVMWMGTETDENDEPLLSENELAQMSLRCEQTTPGPWTSYWEGREKMSGSSFIMTQGEDIYLTGATMADQDFIAHAREDIPRLIAEVQRLRKLASK